MRIYRLIKIRIARDWAEAIESLSTFRKHTSTGSECRKIEVPSSVNKGMGAHISFGRKCKNNFGMPLSNAERTFVYHLLP